MTSDAVSCDVMFLWIQQSNGCSACLKVRLVRKLGRLKQRALFSSLLNIRLTNCCVGGRHINFNWVFLVVGDQKIKLVSDPCQIFRNAVRFHWHW